MEIGSMLNPINGVWINADQVAQEALKPVCSQAFDGEPA
jgi:hypothetical protein